MDARITLSFEKDVIDKAKAYAESQGISLSRLTEFLYREITRGNYSRLENFPVSDWVHQVAEGRAEYKTKSKGRKSLKDEYFKSKK